MPVRTEDEVRERTPLRPRGWALGCAGTLAVLGLALWGYITWANALPAPPSLPAAPLPSPNGYDVVVSLMPKLQQAAAGVRLWDPGLDPAVLRATVVRQKPHLQQLHAALRLPFRCPRLTYAPDKSYWDPTGFVWHAAKALTAAGTVASADGRTAEAWDRALDAGELAVRLQQGSAHHHLMLSDYLCLAGAKVVDGTAGGLTAAEARRLGGRLDRLIREFPPAEAAWAETRLYQLAGFHTFVRTLPGADAPPVNRDAWERNARNLWYRYLHPKRGAYSQLISYYDTGLREARKPSWQRVDPPLPSDPLAGSMMVSPATPHLMHTRMVGLLQLLRLQLALQEHRAHHGAHPASLDELAPLVMDRVPRDPFSGRAYHYRRTATGYQLYGVGENRLDDGGRSGWQDGDLRAGRLFPPSASVRPPLRL